jgi:hypothetical protein
VPSARPSLSEPLRRVVFVIALASLHAASAHAADRPADRSLTDSARASLSAAATRMVDRTRELGLFALSLVGIDYRYGGDSPDQGLDCSGLIRYVFQEVTGVTLPRTAQELSRIGKQVRARELAPGDLVFFNTRRFAFSHVGIYLGDDRFIHAPSRGGEVGVATLSSGYWQRRYNGARRLVGVLPALMPALVSDALASPPLAPPAATAVTSPPEPSAVSAAPEPALHGETDATAGDEPPLP